jgi:hypothetical protein
MPYRWAIRASSRRRRTPYRGLADELTVVGSGTGKPTEMEDVERTRQGLSFDSCEFNVHHSMWWNPLKTVNREFRQIVAP